MVNSSRDVLADRSLPHSVDIERSILGVILLDNSTLHQALEVLKREDFYLDAHRRIFDKMVALYEKDRAIDPITLREELERSGELEQIGGVSFIASLMDGTPHLRNIEHYAKIVHDKSLLRQLIVASHHIISECFEQEEESELILDKAERAILEIADDRARPGFVTVGEVAKRQLELVEEMAGRPQMITGLPTGFHDFDQMTSGLQRSDLIIIAARPSVGKTSFVLSIAQNVAHAGHTVGISSLEMSKEQLVMRLLCSEAKINMQRFRGGFLNREEWRRLAEGLQRLAACKIFIDDTPGITSLELRAKSRRLKHERGLDLLIVDYLQLMSGRGRTESRQQEVSQISRDLKAIAKDLQVPLIAVSQLSRAPEARTDHRPQLSDLRESGCLAGDSLVTLAESGAQVPIRDLVRQSGFAVWALNEETLKIEPAMVSRAFSTGIKPVYRLTTRLGRTIRATANHKFRVFNGWKRLDELKIGERLALPRRLGSPSVQSMSEAELALLAHLIGDGCTLPRHAAQVTTREKDLAELVASLATEVFGPDVSPRIKKERNWYQVYLSSTRHHTHNVRSAVSEWLSELGVGGLRSYEKQVPQKVFEQPQKAIALFLRHLWATDGSIGFRKIRRRHYPNIDYASCSEQLAEHVQSLLLRTGITSRRIRVPQNGKGREWVAQVVGSEELARLARSDVYWDQIVSIEPDGEADVYDLTVEKHHNFVANNIYLHNSLEQDSDVVAFLFRQELYHPTPETEGKADLIVAKQRNGPTGTIELAFIREFTRFENLVEGSPYELED